MTPLLAKELPGNLSPAGGLFIQQSSRLASKRGANSHLEISCGGAI